MKLFTSRRATTRPARSIKLGAAQRRLLRGYGPLVAIIVAFLLMVLLVPTVAREQIVLSGGTSGAGASNGGDTSGGNQGGGGGQGSSTSRTSGGLPGHTSPCPGQAQQVPGDPYSPPCIAFSGDNGGATTRGVTGDTILVSGRLTSDRGLQDALAQVAGAQILDSPEDIRRTIDGLVDYFNQHFQFYGRKLKQAPYQGQGSLTTELLGGGQNAANADAIKVASELGAFADLTAATEPYADALSRQHVLNLGSPYLSKQWYETRQPYAWSLAPDCTTLGAASSEYANKRLFGKPAQWAGGSLQGKPRKIAIIAPDNPWYQECVDAGLALLRAAGNDVAARISYSIDLTTLSSQAASIIARVKDQQDTSVACFCDPVLPVYLTGKAREQNYYPEWLVTGVALTDTDLVGQLYDQSEWVHAFGASGIGQQVPRRATFGYAAYKSVRSDEPANTVDLIYFQMYMLAIGIEMAGPNLTPASYQQGMFAYPGGTGLAGTWKMGPGQYTPQRDIMEVWWDPNRTSVYNGKQGAYVTSGRRYLVGQIPAGNPQVFGQ